MPLTLFSEALQTTPTRALIIRKAWDAHAKNVVVPYTPEASLSLFTGAHMTESQYTKIRSQAKMKHCNICPIYHVIKAAKGECYPPMDEIVTHESFVEVDLQALMDRTASRIMKAKKNAIGIVLDDISKEFVLISKWGYDGSTGHKEYKQRSLGDVSDSDFLSHL
jgi:hypothetical protein